MGGVTEPDGTWMRLCGYRIAGPPGATEAQLADEIRSLMWTESTESDRVQHIRVRPAGNTEPDSAEYLLDVGVLVMSDDDDRARAVGARICAGALAAGPDTVGWTLKNLF